MHDVEICSENVYSIWKIHSVETGGNRRITGIQGKDTNADNYGKFSAVRGFNTHI